jgi:NitT/TauT family transport system permease protein
MISAPTLADDTRASAEPPRYEDDASTVAEQARIERRQVRRRAVVRTGLGLLGFAVAVAAWYVVAVTEVYGGGLVPRPLAVAEEAFDFVRTDAGRDAIWASLRRVLLGMGIGVGLAVPIGFLLGWYWPLRAAAEPLLNFFRALPPIALIPLVILYIGIGEQARVSVLAWATFFVSVIIMFEGVRSVEAIYIKAAQVLGATGWEIFRKVVLPLTVPHLLTAVRVSLAIAWATLVAAELVAAQSGLGATIKIAANFFNVERMYAGILMIGALAVVMDLALRVLTARVLRWQDVVRR